MLCNYGQENMLKDMNSHHFLKNYLTYIKKQLLDTRLDSLKSVSSKVVHKTSESLGNKIANVVTNLYEEMIILPEKREEILKELRQLLLKWNTIKYLSY